MCRNISEFWVVILMAMVQFIHTVDFMMIMPLGPDFARELNISLEYIGIIGGIYTFGAALVGIVLVSRMDCWGRRQGLVFSLIGLGIATVCTAFASDLWSLLMLRFVAGLFGGPVSSFAVAIVIDRIPVQRRGKAMGVLATSFSISSILGVPIGLELAFYFGWQSPFVIMGIFALLMAGILRLILPSMKDHQQFVEEGAKSKAAPKTAPLSFRFAMLQKDMRTGFFLVSLSLFASFMFIPHLATYFQNNLGYPREAMGWLYFIGGIVSFVAMTIAGRGVDRFGALPFIWLSTLGFMTTLVWGFTELLPVFVPLIFMGFMGFNSVRTVTLQTVTSMIPPPSQRAGYMGLIMSMRHIASGLGAVVSSMVLIQSPQGALLNLPILVVIAVIASMFLPLLVSRLLTSLHQAH